MRPEDIRFLTVDAEIVTPQSNDDDRRKMEAIEIKKPDGNVSVFPADAVNAESGQRYCDLFAAKYEAFKRGDMDPDRADQLQREIDQRQAELDANKRAEAPTGEKRRQADDGGHQGVTVDDDDEAMDSKTADQRRHARASERKKK